MGERAVGGREDLSSSETGRSLRSLALLSGTLWKGLGLSLCNTTHHCFLEILVTTRNMFMKKGVAVFFSRWACVLTKQDSLTQKGSLITDIHYTTNMCFANEKHLPWGGVVCRGHP